MIVVASSEIQLPLVQEVQEASPLSQRRLWGPAWLHQAAVLPLWGHSQLTTTA